MNLGLRAGASPTWVGTVAGAISGGGSSAGAGFFAVHENSRFIAAIEGDAYKPEVQGDARVSHEAPPGVCIMDWH